MSSKTHLLLPMLLLAQAATAQTISEGEALDAALQFVSSQRMAPGAHNGPQLTLAHKSASGDETYYYVFNNATGGFVIVAGDQVAEQILGYSDDGSFDYNDLPSNMRWWLSQYDEEISYAIKAVRNNPELQNAPRKAPAAQPEIEPLLDAIDAIEWNQDLPYNALIPGNEGVAERNEQYATGCVATAMAQIMKYHNYPQHGIGRKTYVSNGNTYSADFGSATYDWSGMANRYENSYSGTTAENAVAELMYHVGVALNMNYGKIGTGGSGTSTQAVATALKTHFGYSTGTKYIARYSDTYKTNDALWESTIYNELIEGRPVCYGGDDKYSESGHEFVCDGYKDGKYHINWGWGGYRNSYFLLTAVSGQDALFPNGTGVGGAGTGAAYSRNQDAVIGIMPDPTNEGDLFIPDPVKLKNGGYYEDKTNIELIVIFANPTSSPITVFNPMAWFYNSSGNSVTYLDTNANLVIPAKTEKELVFPTTPETGTSKYSEFIVGKSFNGEVTDYNGGIKNRFARFEIHLVSPINVSYTLTAAEWGTICLPFDAEIPAGITAYNITGVSGDVLTKTPATKFEMNKAYLINGTPSTYNFTGPDTPKGTYKNGLLYGITMPTYVPKDSYVLQNKGGKIGFYRVDVAESFMGKAYSAYLTLDGGMTPARIFVEDEEAIDGIEEIINDNNAAPNSYNLLGQPINNGNGMVIKNGKLNFVK